MLINEVSKQTGLTKKAIAYYVAKGLVMPSESDNGYREFCKGDLSTLKKIALYRKLDMSIDDIRQINTSNSREIFNQIAVKSQIHNEYEQKN